MVEASLEQRELFEQLIRLFEERQVPYCLLAGYDEYPQVIPSDVDFMVPPEWAPRLAELMLLLAARAGVRLVQCIRHETSAAYFVLVRQDGARLICLHPDSSTDYRYRNRLLLPAAQVLAGRRRHGRGFWIPAAAQGFGYYLIKKIDKGALSERQAHHLLARFREDPAGCVHQVRSLLPAAAAQRVETALHQGSLMLLNPHLAELKKALWSRLPREPLDERLPQLGAEALRLLQRVAQPTGFTVAFLGPDGSGKSAVSQAVAAALAPVFRRVAQRHLLPAWESRGHRATPPVLDPYGKPPRGPWTSVLKLLHFWGRHAAGHLLWGLPSRICSTLIVFDRCYLDLLADPRRYRVLARPWILGLARWLGRCLPQPDLIFVLDAAPEILQARKSEVSLEQSRRQRQAYLRLAASLPPAQVQMINVSQPQEQVVAQVLGHVLDALAARTLARLGQAAATEAASWNA